MAVPMNGNGPEITYRPVPFDYLSCGPQAFPYACEVDDFALSKALVDVGAKYVISDMHKKPLSFILEQVRAVLKSLPTADSEFGEINVVGPFAKGTSLATTPETAADIAVVLKSLPTAETLISKTEQFREAIKNNPTCNAYIVENKHYGFDVFDASVRAHVKFTVTPNLLREHKPELHLDYNLLLDTMKANRRTPWFISRARKSPLENFTRILLDVKSRFPGLQALDDWHIEIYAYHSLGGVTVTGQPVSLSMAFKRFFQMFAAGALLPNAPTLADPVPLLGQTTPITACYTLEQMDEICQTAQTICRLILMGRFYEVFGLLPIPAEDPLVICGKKAYNPEDDPTVAVTAQ